MKKPIKSRENWLKKQLEKEKNTQINKERQILRKKEIQKKEEKIKQMRKDQNKLFLSKNYDNHQESTKRGKYKFDSISDSPADSISNDYLEKRRFEMGF